jgi:hypothetical protein
MKIRQLPGIDEVWLAAGTTSWAGETADAPSWRQEEGPVLLVVRSGAVDVTVGDERHSLGRLMAVLVHPGEHVELTALEAATLLRVHLPAGDFLQP